MVVTQVIEIRGYWTSSSPFSEEIQTKI